MLQQVYYYPSKALWTLFGNVHKEWRRQNPRLSDKPFGKSSNESWPPTVFLIDPAAGSHEP